LTHYAKRISRKLNISSLNWRFGGILVQEMSKHLNAHKVLIISSVKSNLEFPLRLKLAKTTKAYKLSDEFDFEYRVFG
jgi:hypothetical protein